MGETSPPHFQWFVSRTKPVHSVWQNVELVHDCCPPHLHMGQHEWNKLTRRRKGPSTSEKIWHVVMFSRNVFQDSVKHENFYIYKLLLSCAVFWQYMTCKQLISGHYQVLPSSFVYASIKDNQHWSYFVICILFICCNKNGHNGSWKLFKWYVTIMLFLASCKKY